MNRQFSLYSFISSALFSLCFWVPEFAFLLWGGLIPFFWVLLKSKPENLWKYGLINGLGTGLLFQYWIFDAAENISGESGIIVFAGYFFLIAIYLLLPLSFAFIISAWRKLSLDQKPLLTSILLPFIWVSLEWIHLSLFSGLPWANVFWGYPQAQYPELIQIASFTGIWGVSLLVGLVNSIFTFSILKKSIPLAAAGGGLLLLTGGAGSLALKQFEKQTPDNSIKTSLILENFSHEVKWNQQTGDSLANILFSLNKKAAEAEPELVLWSEGVLPWTFSLEDDFVRRCLEITATAKAEHVIGVRFPDEQKQGYAFNSALLASSTGGIKGVVHKKHLLSFLEAPVFSQTPFSFLSAFDQIGASKKLSAGKKDTVLPLKKTKAGVGICNEWLLPYAIRQQVNSGATILLNLGNNGYFELPFMTHIHYWQSVMRAVENRRDIAVNCNYGYSGKISASGKSDVIYTPNNPNCKTIELSPSEKKTFYTSQGDWLPKLSLIMIGAFFVSTITFSSKQK